jgi:hypothetical protein
MVSSAGSILVADNALCRQYSMKLLAFQQPLHEFDIED